MGGSTHFQIPDIKGAVDRHRADLPLSLRDLESVAEAGRLILDTDALYLVDPRLHPVLSGCWPEGTPDSCLWTSGSVRPCREARRIMGQEGYKGACTLIACDEPIANILRTFLLKGPGPDLIDALVDAKTGENGDPFLVQLLAGLMGEEHAPGTGDNIWLATFAVEEANPGAKRLRGGSKIVQEVLRKGFQNRATNDLAFTRWGEGDRLPQRCRDWGNRFHPEARQRLIREFRDQFNF
jgi:hypothetical protein